MLQIRFHHVRPFWFISPILLPSRFPTPFHWTSISTTCLSTTRVFCSPLSHQARRVSSPSCCHPTALFLSPVKLNRATLSRRVIQSLLMAFSSSLVNASFPLLITGHFSPAPIKTPTLLMICHCCLSTSERIPMDTNSQNRFLPWSCFKLPRAPFSAFLLPPSQSYPSPNQSP